MRAVLLSVRESRSFASIHLRAIQSLLALVCQPGSNDPDDTFFRFRVDDDCEPTVDRADGDEAILEVGMFRVEDLENLGFGLEEAPSLGEREAVLPLVAEVLRVILLEVHRQKCKSLA